MKRYWYNIFYVGVLHFKKTSSVLRVQNVLRFEHVAERTTLGTNQLYPELGVVLIHHKHTTLGNVMVIGHIDHHKLPANPT